MGQGRRITYDNQKPDLTKPMNSIKPYSQIGRSLGLLLVLAVAGSAYAGPGFQYWQSAGKSAAQPSKPAVTAPAMGCHACTDTVGTAISATNTSGKWAPHTVAVGSKHECSMCGGAITTVGSKTTTDMTANCPVCTNAKPSCCKA